MIEIKDKMKCCGCEACAQVCSSNSISMQPDEQGFLYPVINETSCTKCGKCEDVCPIINVQPEHAFKQTAYLIQHKNAEILAESTSGGAFSAIAQVVLEQGGVVFGAAFDDSFGVHHTYVEKQGELGLFRNSKYVQSTINDTFKNVKRFLNDKRLVCFSGTPCQIEGLKRYLKIEYSYLLTIDIVCHAVPSPLVWKTYLNILKSNGDSQIKEIYFRDKSKYGYLYSQFSYAYEGGSGVKRYEGVEENIMLRAFFSEICSRPSCYDCKFKKRYRISDMTMWDCFDLKEFTISEKFDLNKGVSRLLVHTEKGRCFIEQMKEKCTYENITPEKALAFDVREMVSSVKPNKKYEAFWNLFYVNPEKALYTYFPLTISVKVESCIRRLAFRAGVYSKLRNYYKRLLGSRKR